MIRRVLVCALFLFFLQSCLTYYEKNIIFHQEFASGDYVKANVTLDNNKYIQKSRNQLLYYLDKGVTLQMMGKFEESNKFFEDAYIYIEDFKRNYGMEALAFVTNDMMRNYGGEDFEQVFIHYYKANNYIMMDLIDEALVEIRRINIKLNEISDKYKSEKKYKRDAFAHVMMGLMYEASGDENNAFIAYRNAYDIYESDFTTFFKLNAPLQLKKDLVRTAYLNGFYEEAERYEKKFNIQYVRDSNNYPELIFIWHNGLGPIKDEWSINFIIIRGSGGYVSFVNKELGLTFGFYTHSQDEYNSLGNLKVIRVAFPKYSVRKGTLTGAAIAVDNQEYPVELLEDFNKIAKKSLHDRMTREMSKTLLRVALKQAAEYAARQENEGLGAALSVLNAATEKADTRNWQTLPAQVFYTRVPLASDTNIVNHYSFKGAHKKLEESITVVPKKKIQFLYRQTVPKESILKDKF